MYILIFSIFLLMLLTALLMKLVSLVKKFESLCTTESKCSEDPLQLFDENLSAAFLEDWLKFSILIMAVTITLLFCLLVSL